MPITIHPTAIVEDGATFNDNVTIGAYAYIGKFVCIGEGSYVHHHATVSGNTQIGKNNIIHPYAYIGAPTHDLKYLGGDPGLRIGNNNVFREFTTIHVATKETDFTVIGNNNVFLAYAHVAHDCIVHDNIIMSSHAALGGHVELHDFSNIGWNCGIHQFCKVGKYSMVGASSKATQDIMPYMLAEGIPAGVRSPNFVNLKRKNFSEDRINQIKKIFKIFYAKGLNRTQAFEELTTCNLDQEIFDELLKFIDNSTRGLA